MGKVDRLHRIICILWKCTRWKRLVYFFFGVCLTWRQHRRFSVWQNDWPNTRWKSYIEQISLALTKQFLPVIKSHCIIYCFAVLKETKTHPTKTTTTKKTFRIRICCIYVCVVWCACVCCVYVSIHLYNIYVCLSPIWRIGGADDFSRYIENDSLRIVLFRFLMVIYWLFAQDRSNILLILLCVRKQDGIIIIRCVCCVYVKYP